MTSVEPSQSGQVEAKKRLTISDAEIKKLLAAEEAASDAIQKRREEALNLVLRKNQDPVAQNLAREEQKRPVVEERDFNQDKGENDTEMKDAKKKEDNKKMKKAEKEKEQTQPGGGDGSPAPIPGPFKEPDDVDVRPDSEPGVWKKIELKFLASKLLVLWSLIYEWQKDLTPAQRKYVYCYVIRNSHTGPDLGGRAIRDETLEAEMQFSIVVVWKDPVYINTSEELKAKIIEMQTRFEFVYNTHWSAHRPIKAIKSSEIEEVLLNLRDQDTGILKSVFSPGTKGNDTTTTNVFNGLHYKYPINADQSEMPTLETKLKAFTGFHKVKDESMLGFDYSLETGADELYKLVMKELTSTDQSRKFRDRRNSGLPEVGPSPGCELVSSSPEKSQKEGGPGMFQALLDYYGLELVPDHHTLRCAPRNDFLASSSMMGDFLELDPAYAVLPAHNPLRTQLGTNSSARQPTTSAEFTRASSGDVALIPRMMQDRQTAIADAFMRYYMSPEGQRFKFFMFHYVFCAFEIFPVQKRVLFPRLVWDTSVFSLKSRIQDLQTEREFWAEYTTALYENEKTDRIVSILKEGFPKLVPNQKDIKETQKMIREELEDLSRGITMNIMPVGRVLDNVHTALSAYGVFGNDDELRSIIANLEQGMLYLGVDIDDSEEGKKNKEEVIKAIQAKIATVDGKATFAKIVKEHLSGVPYGVQSHGPPVLAYGTKVLDDIKQGSMAVALKEFVDASLTIAMRRVSDLSVYLYGNPDTKAAFLAAITDKIKEQFNAAPSTNYSGMMNLLMRLADDVLREVLDSVKSDTRFTAWALKIVQAIPAKVRTSTRVVESTTTAAGNYILNPVGNVPGNLADELVKVIVAAAKPVRGGYDPDKYDANLPTKPARAWFMDSLALVLKVTRLDLKVKVEKSESLTLRGELEKRLTDRCAPYEGRQLLERILSDDTIRKSFSPDDLLKVYKRLVIGHYPISREDSNRSSFASYWNSLELKLDAIRSKYSAVNSVYFVQARDKDDMERTYDRLFTIWKSQMDDNEKEKLASKLAAKKFWDAHQTAASEFYVADADGNFKQFNPDNGDTRSLLVKNWLYGIARACEQDVESLKRGMCATEDKQILDIPSGHIEHANTHLFGSRGWKHWAIFLDNHINLIFPTIRDLRSRTLEFEKNIPELKDEPDFNKRVVMGLRDKWMAIDGNLNVGAGVIDSVLGPMFRFMLQIVNKVKPPKNDAENVLRRVNDWVVDLKLARDDVVARGEGVSDIDSAKKKIDELLKVFATPQSDGKWLKVNQNGLEQDLKPYPVLGNTFKALLQIDKFISPGSVSELPPMGYMQLLRLRYMFVDVISSLVNINVPRAYIRELMFDYNQTSGVLAYIYAPTNEERLEVTDKYLRGVRAAFINHHKKVPLLPDAWEDEIKRMNARLQSATRYLDELGNKEALQVKPIATRKPRTRIGDFATADGNAVISAMDTSEG